ncbi:MAG: hypothetical protein QW292_06725 [Candidatus Parvarchaeota archaeon]
MDIFLYIKTREKYSVMNITHAAAVIFYEIFKKNLNIEGPMMAEREDLDRYDILLIHRQ